MRQPVCTKKNINLDLCLLVIIDFLIKCGQLVFNLVISFFHVFSSIVFNGENSKGCRVEIHCCILTILQETNLQLD